MLSFSSEYEMRNQNQLSRSKEIFTTINGFDFNTFQNRKNFSQKNSIDHYRIQFTNKIILFQLFFIFILYNSNETEQK